MPLHVALRSVSCEEREYPRSTTSFPGSLSLMVRDTSTALIHGVSGGVSLGFRSEAAAVEHFQKGVKGGTVVVRKAVA